MKPTILILCLLSVAALLLATRLYAQKSQAKEKAVARALAFNPYADYPIYAGTDLGVTYTKASTRLRIWAPPAEEMKLKLYKSAAGNDLLGEVNCTKDQGGTWTAELLGDRKGQYYTFQAKIKGEWQGEYPDPYAKAVGVNGLRGQVIDLRETDPPGWDFDIRVPLKHPTDAILYELHVRDLSVAPNSGIRNKGKFLAFTEYGTVNDHKQSTGIDHIAQMGVTHVHLLPSFDFITIDESKPEVPQYNWGYDPQNFNVPEGSYSTDPNDGKVRIREFKEMVLSMHRQGLRVVMDVVYNHTARTRNSNFDQQVPGYYYRQWEKDGKYSNASGCGNETASDREMMRKFIVESVTYWVKEYHVDGFRFDLMAIHDLETMDQVSKALHAIDSTILIYGEGWTAGDSPLPEQYRALKVRAKDMDGIAVFSDDIRDGIKGSVFDDKSTGFASGATDMTEQVKFGIVAAGEHPQVDYAKVKYSKAPYTKSPSEVINYASCHDNHTLYDKLKVSRPDATEAELVMMDKLANTIVMTSQGIPFMQAGEEMKRTKGGEHNSFNKPDSVNRINWEWKYENRDLVEYYQGLIALRRAHPAFRMPTQAMIREHLVFLPSDDPHLIAYRLTDHANGDPWKEIMVFFNGSGEAKRVTLPEGNWDAALNHYDVIRNGEIVGGDVSMGPYSAMILYRE